MVDCLFSSAVKLKADCVLFFSSSFFLHNSVECMVDCLFQCSGNDGRMFIFSAVPLMVDCLFAFSTEELLVD